MASLPKDPVFSSLKTNRSQNSPSCTRLFARYLSPPPGMSPQNTGTWSVPGPQPTPGPLPHHQVPPPFLGSHVIPGPPPHSPVPTLLLGPHPAPGPLPCSRRPPCSPASAPFRRQH